MKPILLMVLILFSTIALPFDLQGRSPADGDFIMNGIYKSFNINHPLNVGADEKVLKYRFFIKRNKVHEISLIVHIDPRIPKNMIGRYNEYEPSARIDVSYSIRTISSDNKAVLLAKEKVDFREKDIFPILLYIGQNEIFSLPEQIDVMEPLHVGGAYFDYNAMLYCERAVPSGSKRLWRFLHDDESTLFTGLENILMRFVGNKGISKAQAKNGK